MKIAKTKKMFAAHTIILAMGLFSSSQVFATTREAAFEYGSDGALAINSSDGFTWNYPSSTSLSNVSISTLHESKSARFYFPANNPNVGATIENTGIAPSEGSQVWFRAKVYFPVGWNWACAPVVKIIRIPAKTGFMSVFADAAGRIVLSNEPGEVQSGNEIPNNGATFDIGKWQYVEIYCKFSAIDGNAITRIWKNGVLLYNDTTRNLGSGTNTTLYVVFNYWNGGSPVNQFAYVDDIHITDVLPSKIDANGYHMIGPGLLPPGYVNRTYSR